MADRLILAQRCESTANGLIDVKPTEMAASMAVSYAEDMLREVAAFLRAEGQAEAVVATRPNVQELPLDAQAVIDKAQERVFCTNCNATLWKIRTASPRPFTLHDDDCGAVSAPVERPERTQEP